MWKPCVKSILNLCRFQCKKYVHLPTITIKLIKRSTSNKIGCNAHGMLRFRKQDKLEKMLYSFNMLQTIFYICTVRKGEHNATFFTQIWFGDRIYELTIPFFSEIKAENTKSMNGSLQNACKVKFQYQRNVGCLEQIGDLFNCPPTFKKVINNNLDQTFRS